MQRIIRVNIDDEGRRNRKKLTIKTKFSVIHTGIIKIDPKLIIDENGNRDTK